VADYFKDTRYAKGIPVSRYSYVDPNRPINSFYDEVVRPDKFLNQFEKLNKYPGYQDSVRSFRTNRSVGPSTVSGKLLSNVPIIEELTETPKQDSGHEFDAVQHSIIPWNKWRDFTLNYDVSIGNAGPRTYRGPVFLSDIHQDNRQALGLSRNIGQDFSLFGEAPADVAPSWGTKAIQKCAPTKSNASIATALIELRDGLPKMPGRALKNARGFKDLTKVGPEEFLNYVFGLVPTIGDLRSLASGIVNQKKILDQFQRDNDKVVRRRYGFPVRSSDQSWSAWVPATRLSILPSNGSDYGPSSYDSDGILRGGPTVTRSFATRERIWFSGAFRYHLATTDSQWGRIERTSQLMAHLLGARLDFESMWAAMPWSWLVDWFSDVGDIVANASRAIYDGQLLQYGYVMCHTTHYNTYTFDDISNSKVKPSDLTTVYVTQRKQRVKATPYGFGLNPDSFSAQQWSILGALGLTKGVNRLP